jgi:hypothetical protein
MFSQVENPDSFGDDVISVYTRQDAINDGVLVDVTETAKEIGFRYPVAVTNHKPKALVNEVNTVWGIIENIPPSKQGIEDVEGRLWDVLWMAKVAIRTSRAEDTSMIPFDVLLSSGKKKKFTFKVVCNPGDNAEPVLTIMLPYED